MHHPSFKKGYLIATDDFALAEVLEVSKATGITIILPLVSNTEEIIKYANPAYSPCETIKRADPAMVKLWGDYQRELIEGGKVLALFEASSELFLELMVRRKKMDTQLEDYKAGWLQ